MIRDETINRVESMRQRAAEKKRKLWDEIQRDEPVLAELLREARQLGIKIEGLRYERITDK